MLIEVSAAVDIIARGRYGPYQAQGLRRKCWSREWEGLQTSLSKQRGTPDCQRGVGIPQSQKCSQLNV